MSCRAMRGGLKSSDRVGATKKRVHFLDETKASINGPIDKVDLEEDGAQTHAEACELAEAPSLEKATENAADIDAGTAVDLMQNGLQLQESCHVTDKELNAVKDFKNATLLCEAVGHATAFGMGKERPYTPPPCASSDLASPQGVFHSQPQVNCVQRKLLFGIEPTREHCHSSKFMFTSKKNLSKSQNFYKVVPETEEGMLAMNVSASDDHHLLQTQASSLSFEDACKKRCAWITPQSDAVYVAYHDEEWGVPVHEDRRLFELLVFAGAQAEIAWSTLLAKREAYRNVFAQFDPTILVTYDMAKVASLRSHNDIMRSEARVQSIVNNARLVMKIVEEHGSFDAYLWGFVGNRPIVNRYKQPKLIPVRTGKSEAISKDLQRRGFRHAGPIVIYSLMQAAGLANDHLLSCFRHHTLLPSSPPTPPPPPHHHHQPPSLRKPAQASSARKPLVTPLCC